MPVRKMFLRLKFRFAKYTLNSKTCELDPISSRIVKQHAKILAPFITALFNKSLASGVIPDAFKRTIVTPLLKKNWTRWTRVENYRPVSNLSYLSKFLEKVVYSRLLVHLEATGAMPRTQSAYRSNHSTETALLTIFNDIAVTVDSGTTTAACFLYLTAVFDTVHRGILLARLEKTYGFSRLTLWNGWVHI